MEEKELKKLQNRTLAQVCDGLAKVTKALKKDCKTKKQKMDLDKRAETFKNFAKIFRSLNKGGKRASSQP